MDNKKTPATSTDIILISDESDSDEPDLQSATSAIEPEIEMIEKLPRASQTSPAHVLSSIPDTNPDKGEQR